MNNKKGFSLIELLVVIAIIAILAALLLPALAKSKQSASKALCISNQKQLNYAMSQLALDSDDKIAYASAWHNEPTAPRAWVADSMSGGSRWSKWAQTERSLIWSPLFKYAGKGIYRCPEDKSYCIPYRITTNSSVSFLDSINFIHSYRIPDCMV